MTYPIVDGHCDTVLKCLPDTGKYVFEQRNKIEHLDLPRMRDGGVKLQFFAVYIESEYKPEGALCRCLQLVDCFYRKVVGAAKGDLQIVSSSAHLREVMNGPSVGCLLSVEGGEALEGELAVLRVLFRLGVRALGLTWNQRNELAVGVGDSSQDGLTAFGRDVIREMNRLGMLVDLAHINKKGFYEAVSLSETPVVVSHANARALCDHPRNLTDEQLKVLAEQKGIIGLSFCPQFVHRKEPSLEKLLDHFVHVTEVAGIEHVGIGSDYDGIESPVSGLDDVSCLPALVDGLNSRGFTTEEVKKITSENYLRVLGEVLPAHADESC